MISPANKALSALLAIFCIHGCAPAQDTFLQIQMCVIDQQGVAEFKSTMRDIAASEHLEFVDGSIETARELKVIGADKLLKRDAAFTINVGIQGGGRNFVMGSNLGLPPYQITLGFGPGSDTVKAHRLSKRLVQAFSQRWRVEEVPLGQGVQPVKSCGG